MICNSIKVKSDSIEVKNNFVLINVNGLNFDTLSNLQKIDLIICQTIPNDAGTLPVKLSDGTNKVEILVRTGNILRADQIKCRTNYPMIFGNDDVHFSLLNLVPESSYEELLSSVSEKTVSKSKS